jgi:hypothetical protein
LASRPEPSIVLLGTESASNELEAVAVILLPGIGIACGSVVKLQTLPFHIPGLAGAFTSSIRQ